MTFSNENTTRTVTADEISTWKVQELKSFCKENKIKGYSKLRKAELIELVTKFLETHDTAASTKSLLSSIKPAPLTEKFAKPGKAEMREYVKRRKLAEEKEFLRCWRAVLSTLNKSNKAAELDSEIDAVLRNIEICQRRIAALEKPAVSLNIDFSEAIKAAAIYTENFMKTFRARKNRKAA